MKNIAIIKIKNSTFHRLSSTEQNQTKQIKVWIVSSFLNINRTYSKIDFKNQLSFLVFMNSGNTGRKKYLLIPNFRDYFS